jgi:RsiG-like
MGAVDDIPFDRLINIQSYSDEELRELILQLGQQEAELSKKRRLLHGEIDILKAERSRRERDKQGAGEDSVSGRLDVLAEILTGRRSQAAAGGEEDAEPSRPEAESLIRGIQKRFRDLSVDVREERVLRYIVRQVRLGRQLDDIMADSYIIDHTSNMDRDMLLQNPAVLRAVENEIVQQFADFGSETGPTAKDDSPR